MDTRATAEEFASLCRAGRWEEAAERVWDDDVVSVEPMGELREVRGRAAVLAKGAAWSAANDIRAAQVSGPYVNGDRFALHMAFEVVDRATGEARPMTEVALYTLRDGKVVEERFFY
jgi:ketosteroid isomerase-like protein